MEQGVPPGNDTDGVRVTERAPRRSRRRIGVAVLVAVVTLGLVGWRIEERRLVSAASTDNGGITTATSRLQGDASAFALASRGPGARAGIPDANARVDGEDPTQDLSDYVLPGEAPTMEQVIKALHARGIRTGLGAFPPPGTSPPLRGIAVPDGFPLPDGYVRHHQATDDGQSIPPILMFAPDREWIDIRGVRVRIPQDRLVMPELAPAGMPLRWVNIPPPRDTGGRP